jgi:hypothetical protein
MTQLVTTRIRACADRLGLTHLGEVVDQLAARADTEQMGYLDFLDLLLQEELGLRESRRCWAPFPMTMAASRSGTTFWG